MTPTGSGTDLEGSYGIGKRQGLPLMIDRKVPLNTQVRAQDTGVETMQQLMRLTKRRRITGPEREAMATRLRDRYAQGASIRELMAQTGRSYGWTHRLLRESGAELRGRGGARPPRRTDPAQPTAGPATTSGTEERDQPPTAP